MVPSGGRLHSVKYGNGRFVALGTTCLTSSNGLTWVEHPPPPFVTDQPHLVFAQGLFVAAGFARRDPGWSWEESIWSSVDGIDWVERLPIRTRSIHYAIRKLRSVHAFLCFLCACRAMDYAVEVWGMTVPESCQNSAPHGLCSAFYSHLEGILARADSISAGLALAFPCCFTSTS